MKSQMIPLLSIFIVGFSACSGITSEPAFNTRAVEVEGKCYEHLDTGERSLASECFVLLSELGKPASAAFGLGTLAMSSGLVAQAKHLFNASYQLGLMNGLLGLAIAEEINGEIRSARRHYELFLLHNPASVQGMHNYAQHLKLHFRDNSDLKIAERLLFRASILNQEQLLSPYYQEQAELLRVSSMR